VFSIFIVVPDVPHASPNQTKNFTTSTPVTGLNPSFESPGLSNSTREQSTPNPDSQINNTIDNTIADNDLTDIAQLSENEKVVIAVNFFTSKSHAFQTDYSITGKPTCQ
jgi:hypothetical protein